MAEATTQAAPPATLARSARRGGAAPEAGAADGAAKTGPNLDFLAIFYRGDILMALGISAILVVLILPLPRWLLDVSLAFSLTFSVLILMTALFIEKPLEFT